MKKHWKTMLFLLGPGMLWGWMISGLLMWALFPKLDFLSCLVIAAAVTPTDPILAQAVIGGKFADKHVPAHVRHMLAAESGCNDGAAFPFLGIALYLTLDKSDGHAVGHWFYYTL
jgi:NhaP-type Na+/H+ or K+/H+ antiporter